MTNPLRAPYQFLLPFLPEAREVRKHHDALYCMYEGILDQLEVRPLEPPKTLRP